MPLPSTSVANPRCQERPARGAHVGARHLGARGPRALRRGPVKHVGDRLAEALLRCPGCRSNATACKFGQQIDAKTWIPEPPMRLPRPDDPWRSPSSAHAAARRRGAPRRRSRGAAVVVCATQQQHVDQSHADARERTAHAAAGPTQRGRSPSRFGDDLSGKLTAVVGFAGRGAAGACGGVDGDCDRCSPSLCACQKCSAAKVTWGNWHHEGGPAQLVATASQIGTPWLAMQTGPPPRCHDPQSRSTGRAGLDGRHATHPPVGDCTGQGVPFRPSRGPVGGVGSRSRGQPGSLQVLPPPDGSESRRLVPGGSFCRAVGLVFAVGPPLEPRAHSCES